MKQLFAAGALVALVAMFGPSPASAMDIRAGMMGPQAVPVIMAFQSMVMQYQRPPQYGGNHGGYGKPHQRSSQYGGNHGGYGKPQQQYGSGGYGGGQHQYMQPYLPPSQPRMTCIGGFAYKDMRDGQVRCWPDHAPTPPPGKRLQ